MKKPMLSNPDIRFKHLVFLIVMTFQCLLISGQETSKEEPDRTRRILALPLITYSPETSLRLGVMGVYLFRFNHSNRETRLSQLKLPLSYTVRNQIRLRTSFDLSFTENRHVIDGQIFWIRFPLLFYGIGNDTPDENEELYTTQTALVEINYFGKITPNIFLGGRVDIADGKIIETDKEGLLRLDQTIPGRLGGRKSGIGINARWDRRVNIINATKGPFIDAALTIYPEWLGSEFEYTKLRLDFRHYFPLQAEKYLLGINFLTEANWGDPSFEYMALLGGDQIMRGHVEGRFRDNVMWAGQAEMRIPFGRDTWINKGEIPFKERWGCVAFAGIGNVSSSIFSFTIDNLKTSYGLGIRYLISRDESVNIRLDLAMGTQMPGFYLNIRESF